MVASLTLENNVAVKANINSSTFSIAKSVLNHSLFKCQVISIFVKSCESRWLGPQYVHNMYIHLCLEKERRGGRGRLQIYENLPLSSRKHDGQPIRVLQICVGGHGCD